MKQEEEDKKETFSSDDPLDDESVAEDDKESFSTEEAEEPEVEEPTPTSVQKDDFAQFGPIKRPGEELEHNSNLGQPLNSRRKSNKNTIILIIVLLVVVGGIFFLLKGKNPLSSMISVPTPTPAPTSTPTPTEDPRKSLNRSDWSFEVLNGSGKTGFAKTISDQLKELGYPVIKVGNADNQDYPKTQIFVKQELLDTTDGVIADLKDIIKIASFGGQLKDSTASARIIIGKDSI